MRSILLADEQLLFRDGIAAVIENSDIESKFTAVSGFNQTIDTLKADNNFDVIMIDIDMQGLEDVKDIYLVKEIAPSSNIAVISGAFNKQRVLDLIAIGGISFIPKTIPASQFIEVLRFISNGGLYQPLDVVHKDGGDLSQSSSCSQPLQKSLTPRESDVLTHLGEGLSNKEVASNLGIEEVTVRLHLRGIFRKLEVKNRVQAVIRAIELGLLPQPAPAVGTPPVSGGGPGYS